MCPPELFTNQASGSAGAASQSAAGTASTELPYYVPAHPACGEAYRLAESHIPRSIFNHSVRVYRHAKALGEHESSPWATDPAKLPLLFAACVLHDMGCAAQCNGPQRFEVEGADAAAAHLKQYNEKTGTGSAKFSEADIHDVWVAVALHTSPGIAERITPLARLVRLAVLTDFGKAQPGGISPDAREQMERDLPRLQVEKELGDAVVEQALAQRQKAPPPSWPGILLRAKLENPDWDGVNKAF